MSQKIAPRYRRHICSLVMMPWLWIQNVRSEIFCNWAKWKFQLNLESWSSAAKKKSSRWKLLDKSGRSIWGETIISRRIHPVQDNLDGNWNCTAVHIMARNKIVNRRFQWNTLWEKFYFLGDSLVCSWHWPFGCDECLPDNYICISTNHPLIYRKYKFKYKRQIENIRTVALSLATPGSTVGWSCSTGASRAPPGEEVGEEEVELQGPACAKKPKQ